MSLDIWLKLDGANQNHEGSGIWVRENGQTKEITREEWDDRFPGREPVVAVNDDSESDTVWSGNITHNLNKMADAAGIYDCLWHPGEHGIERAGQMIEPLEAGLARMEAAPDEYKWFDSPNGWGTYPDFLRFVKECLDACKKWPNAKVEVWI